MVNNERMVDRLHEQWLNPPDEQEADDPCFSCFDESEYEIGGKCYCERCAKEEYVDYSDDAVCSICGEETDTSYKVGSEVFCENCFLEVFRK